MAADDPSTVEEIDAAIGILAKKRDKLAKATALAAFRARIQPFVQACLDSADDKAFRDAFERLRREAQSYDAQATNLGSRVA